MLKPERLRKPAKPRNGPGRKLEIPESSKIDGKDAAGKTTKYTEDGNWTQTSRRKSGCSQDTR